ncbi:unnamed protein product [Macrosiphum euphorbiae]|uniref:DUF4371 domain-containing protein n=1 Tax=Macrosiphum euphorbiae TaxID=13131 RepID=A0AAV0WSM4_9HEMI|nr:unnamed protein product [Macrosiphum euphorbiae]
MDRFINRKRKYDNDENTEISDTTLPSTSETLKQSGGKCRYYNESYMDIGFTWCGPKDEPIPECIVCGKMLTNESMVPSKLKRHFIKQHSHLKNKDVHYFRKLLSDQKKEATKFTKKVKVSERAPEASFVVSQMIANNMKGHTIGEKLIKPACKEMVRIMIGNEAALEIDKIPMSNDTVSRRICCMSTDIKELVIEKMKNSRFTLQVDDSTSSDGKCYMIGFVRFVDDNAIISQFLCLKEFKKNTRGKDIFNTIDYFFENNGISWSDCVGICTDGAPSMTGSIKGFDTLA